MQRQAVEVPRLEPKDLFDKRSRRDYARLRAYNTLLTQIYNRIYTTSQLSGSTASITYSVPPFILGLPKLDMEDCIVYLVFQLRQSGFEVRFTWPNLLWISWAHHEKDYLVKHNPIIQAMTPEPPPKPPVVPKPIAQPRKKQAQQGQQVSFAPASNTVAFNSAVDLINNMPPPSTFGLGAPDMNIGLQPQLQRRAADYQPPASFIENMDRPLPMRPSPNTWDSGQKKKEGVKGDVLSDLWSM
jgi:hypothetical protein